MDRRLALTAACVVLAVATAACGGSSAASPAASQSAASPTVVASAAPSASPAASEAAVASTAPTPSNTPVASTAPVASGAVPSIGVPNQDKNLEAILPSTFAGATLQKISMKGSQYLGSSPEMTKVVSELGLTAADVSVAIAGSNGNGPSFVALRFAGADSGKLLQVFQAASVASGEVVTPANVAGKDVLKSTDKAGAITYFYVHNDMVLGVTAKDEATAAAGLALLP
jgi:hypothetical protein